MEQSGGGGERGRDDCQRKKLLSYRGQEVMHKGREHGVGVRDAVAEHHPGERACEVSPAHHHGEREHREGGRLFRLLHTAQREVALDQLRLRPDADGGHYREKDDVEAAGAAGEGEKSVIGPFGRRQCGELLQSRDGAAYRSEERDQQRADADYHHKPLDGFGVQHSAQAAPDDREADDRHQRHQRRVHGDREHSRHHHGRALKDRGAVDDEKNDGDGAEKGLQDRYLVGFGQQLRRCARVELSLPEARRPGEEPVNEPGAEPDVAGGYEQHLQPEEVAEAAEAHQSHGGDVGGDIGERLHDDADLTGQQRVVAARVFGDEDENEGVAYPERREGEHFTSPSSQSSR